MIYRLLFKLVLRWVPAETAHLLAARCLRATTAIPFVRLGLRRILHSGDPRLRVKAWDLTFPNPLGVAGGMDKEAIWFDSLGALGFGFVEVGTVTAVPQPGNPRPRVFRLMKDRALLNSMGFPNPGAGVVAERLQHRDSRTIVGVNLGKSGVVPIDRAGPDYQASIGKLAPLSDFIVLNISSPNTPNLREMQAVEPLRALIADVRAELRNLETSSPILLKIGPDLRNAEIDAIADLALELELDGIVAVNTTVRRDGLVADTASLERPGGISGAPLKDRAIEVLKRLYARADGRMVLISVGGIETADDAWERILAGATLVQSHTGFVYGGPLWPRRITRGLLRHVRESGASSIQELVGTSAEGIPGVAGRSNGHGAGASPSEGASQVPTASGALTSHSSRAG